VHGRSSGGRRPWQAQGGGGTVADLTRDVDRAAVEVPGRIQRVKIVRSVLGSNTTSRVVDHHLGLLSNHLGASVLRSRGVRLLSAGVAC
jgi:hypothetical protein